MTAKERYIAKWEKKLARCKRIVSNPVYGGYCTEERASIPLIEEILKDLKRF